MKVFNNQTLERSSLPGIDHVTLAGAFANLQELTVWRQTIAPGAATPPHRHDCEEVVLCLSGHGELHANGRVLAFQADNTVTIPPDVDHQIINVGTTPMELTAVFSACPVAAYFPTGEKINLPFKE